MRYTEKVFRRLFFCGLAAAVLLSVAALPRDAGAWRSGGYYYYSSGDSRQLQNRAQQEAAEIRREKAREKRADELEKEAAQWQKEYLASQAEIRASSQAAAGAPRDQFYRKPGTFSKTLPGAAAELKVGDQTFHYFRGMFYRQLPDGYIVVPAPVGAVVDKLPEGVSGASYKGDLDTYSYYFGTFFMAEGGKFKVVQPPAETLVGYVPDGYTETGTEGTPRLQFGDITYEPVFFQDTLLFQVVQG